MQIAQNPEQVYVCVRACVYVHVTRTYTQTHRHTDTQTHRHTDTQTHRHTDTQTHRHTQRHTDHQVQWPVVLLAWYLLVHFYFQKQNKILSKFHENSIHFYSFIDKYRKHRKQHRLNTRHDISIINTTNNTD